MNWGIKTSGVMVAVFALLAPLQAQGQSSNPQAVAMYNLALKAYKDGSVDSAVIFFRRATEIDPNLADAQYNLGVIFQTQKRYREAIPRFQEVLRIKPNDPDAHSQLGLVLQETRRPAEARQHLADIAPSNPHFADAQQRIANMGSQAGAQTTMPAADLPGAQSPLSGALGQPP